ncbi:helix-turn-helix transcriptional regulator [Bacillus pseudomycoides]|uniref:helix-turn-helix domain-containing protein n=1 Tax=Bacillus TaxID=1386 RepID=UPI001E506428|nr:MULTISPECIES: helix-turn-helix transcriptional regulator [Bacillus]
MLRKRQNLSQEALAFKAKCYPTYIGQIEHGEKLILQKIIRIHIDLFTKIILICFKNLI